MQALLDMMGSGFAVGRLEFAAPDGRTWTFGRGEPVARLRMRDASVLKTILRNPGLQFGETYMEGEWEPQGCDLRDVMHVAMRLEHAMQARRGRIASLLRRGRARLHELNTPLRSRRNVAHHYDLDFDLYRQFLDADLHYSCAYYAHADDTLEQAQQAKCALIARKLCLKPGARVLDIGCGWGSLALYLAQHHDAQVLGITLSSAQLEVAQRRARERGLDDRVTFRLQDYRALEGQFDAIVSVGMFEHVGRPQYHRYFAQVSKLLAPDGVGLVHTIGRLTPPSGTSPWINKYIFPGGYIPAASEVLPAVEDSGLLLTDLEIWREHYARTLTEWRRRFDAIGALPAHLDERFRRMWRFYLQASESSFIEGGLAVFHLQLEHRLDRVPLTRDYLYRS
jgi:cyclopropane-fatty-acyl-phospholipid synthase